MRNIFKTSLLIVACLWNHALMAQTTETFTFAWTSTGTAGYCYSQSGPTGGALLLNNKIYFTSGDGPKAESSHLNPYRTGFVFCPTHDVTMSWSVAVASSARDFNMRIDTIVNAYFYNAFINAAGVSKTMAEYVTANADATEKTWWQTATSNKVITSKGAAGTDGASKQWFSGYLTGTAVANKVADASKVSVAKNGSSDADVKVNNASYVFKANTWYRLYTDVSSSSGGYMTTMTFTSSAPVISTDATLKSLKYDGTSVDNFSASTLEYYVELPAGTTAIPTVTAEANDSKAGTPAITQAPSLPGDATVTVTAEDGETSLTYTIHFSIASADPVVYTATWPNISGTAVIDHANGTITGKIKYGTGLTAITPTFTGKNIGSNSWTPTGAQDFSNGAVPYTFSSNVPGSGATVEYSVTITEADPQSSDATLKSLKYNGTSVPNFSPSTLTYTVQLPNNTTTVPAVTYELNDTKASAVKTDATAVPGNTTVVVTAEDGTTLTYTIQFTLPVPESGLTQHEPGIYEALIAANGYAAELSVSGSREYEVYYFSKQNSLLTISTTPSGGSINATTSTDKSFEAKDGWITGQCHDTGEGSSSPHKDAGGAAEFQTCYGSMKMGESSSITLHIKGYDEFSIYAADNNTTPSNGENRWIDVYIDNMTTPVTKGIAKAPATVRRYGITTGEHVIKLTTEGSSTSKLFGLSLRIAQEPKTNYYRGNDSTQIVLQGQNMKQIYYITKYNNIDGAETILEWQDNKIPTGIELIKTGGNAESVADTLALSGAANCPTGIYNYAVVAKFNGVEMNRKTGKFIVKSDIRCDGDPNADVYTNEEMEQIIFTYYTLSADSVQLSWPNGQPAGITGQERNGKYVIGGVPTVTGDFPYTITVSGSENTISGVISITTLDLGNNPILFLHKNKDAYKQDAIYKYLKTQATVKRNLIPRKTKIDGAREDYSGYKLIIISEDADADNPEVLAVINGGVTDKPILNLKGFSYATGRLGWGDPDNGAIDSTLNEKVKGCFLHIEQPSHPIFANIPGLKYGDSLKILSDYEQNGIMPVNVKLQGSLCLGTAYTRDIDDYYGYGELQTALHEVPADMREGRMYVCLPLAQHVTLTNAGQKVLDGIVDYLLGATPTTILAPELQITSFSVDGINAKVNDGDNTIVLTIPEEKYDELENAHPVITLVDPRTHVLPVIEESMDLRFAAYIPRTFVVTDYINRRAYTFTVAYEQKQGIEEVYEAGMWVNVFDIYGRKVATTNENIYSMELPQGMYIVVTESGQTIKIMR